MGNKKDKNRWIKIQENNKKTCENCSELEWNKDGNPCCQFGDHSPGSCYCIHSLTYIKHVHAECFDKYNKNKI